jgi:DNA-binding IclR family transcriptional regulator
VKARGFRAMTAHSITTVDKLRKDLERTAARGYSLTVDEHALGVSAVGAPVFAEGLDGTRTCVGVVTVAAPSARRSPAQFEAWAPALIAVARRMGAVWPLEPPRVAPASG